MPAKSTDVSAAEAQAHAAHAPEIVQQSRAAGGLPPPMTAAEAPAQAEAEGLTLARSTTNQSGFLSVFIQAGSKARPYAASVTRDGKKVHLGLFATAEEAALHFARTPEGKAAAALPLPMTADEALAQAEAEGLTLARSDNQSGFRHVSVHPEYKVRPFCASVTRDGKRIYLGCFATAEEAALHVARTPEVQAAAALPPPMTASEALAQAEAEGLTLARSDNQSGFRYVTVQPECKRPYHAVVWRDGKQINLGNFATAEESALHVARTPEAQAAAALPPPMTADEALAQAEAEGLTLARSDNQTGFRRVSVHPARKARPYYASVKRDGKNVHLGSFATAEEAALHVARTPEAQAAAALPLPMTQTEAEGLALVRSSASQSGFRKVVMHPEYKARPYAASVERNGKKTHLGSFATAEEAAQHVARTPVLQAAAALPPPMTASEALAQAKAEGLTLARSDNQSGFRNVTVQPECKSRPYHAVVWRDGKEINLGYFATAEESALHVARTPEAQAAAALPPPMTADEALAQAEAEGLTLARSDNQTGFRHVSVHPEQKARPYMASVTRDGKRIYLGYFATAEEAALHFARTPEAQAAAALPLPMTADEALAQAEAEGLTLARSDNQTGFRHVSVHPEQKARPYMASVTRDGKRIYLGYFATAEEAALHFARTPEAQAAAALPLPMTADEALAQAEAEGLTLARSDNQTGFGHVSVHPERKARPYYASVKRDGKNVHLGNFATAEEAALHVARTPEGQAQAKAEAKGQAKAEAKAQAKAQAQAKAEAKAHAKQVAKAEAVRAREEQKLLLAQHRQ